MRTNVVIDDKLMSRALRSSGCRTKRSTIETGLRLLVQVNSQKKLRTLRGKITWNGNVIQIEEEIPGFRKNIHSYTYTAGGLVKTYEYMKKDFQSISRGKCIMTIQVN